MDMSIGEGISAFIQEELGYDLGRVEPHTDLIEHGIIDSMSFLRLVCFIEETFQIEVRDEDLIPDNFRSISALENFVRRGRIVSVK